MFPLLFQTPCMKKPCQNGGSCVPVYHDNTHRCLCKTGFTGKNCETSKHTIVLGFFSWCPGLNGGGGGGGEGGRVFFYFLCV